MRGLLDGDGAEMVRFRHCGILAPRHRGISGTLALWLCDVAACSIAAVNKLKRNTSCVTSFHCMLLV